MGWIVESSIYGIVTARIRLESTRSESNDNNVVFSRIFLLFLSRDSMVVYPTKTEYVGVRLNESHRVYCIDIGNNRQSQPNS